MRNIILTLVLIFIVSSVHAAEIQAPFGFKWGDTKTQLENKGVLFTECNSDINITTCKTLNAIKSVSFGESYLLLIDSRLGLQKVVMVSKDITKDITGSDGKELYTKVQSSLNRKYGSSESYEYFGNKLYSEYDEFYQCLKYPGCGAWVSLWDLGKGGVASVALKGLSRGKGYLKLVYESKEWSDIVDARKSKEHASDEDAL